MYCLLCHQPIQQLSTWQALFQKRTAFQACSKCMAKFERVEEQPYENVKTLFYYNDAMRDYIHRYKFGLDIALAHVFKEHIQQFLKPYKNATFVPIPLHPEKLKQRTFAQVDELLRVANVPFVHLLEKMTLDSQSGKTLIERKQTTALFRRNRTNLKKDTHVVLVDDIITTGTTIRLARETLEADGFTNISVVVFISARFRKRGDLQHG